MDPDIVFFFDGVWYTVSQEAYNLNRIILPDGRLLEPTSWLETYPPQPQGLHEVDHAFKVDNAFKNESLVDMANKLDAVLAEVQDPDRTNVPE